MNIGLNEEKTRQLLALLADRVDIGKTKLMKLLYLIDFTAYERTGKSITNDQYVHWQFGPVPRSIWRGLNNNLVAGVLQKTTESRGDGTYVRFSPIDKPNMKVFS